MQLPVHSPARIAVTGATGFIGAALVRDLADRGTSVRALSRSAIRPQQGVEATQVSSYHDENALVGALEGIEVLVHVAAIAHRAPLRGPDSGGTFAWNVTDTTTLALACVRAGVRRFVYISSIGVLGSSDPGRPFVEEDPPAPAEPYAISKWQAEQALRWVAHRYPARFEFVIIRPPLVYGAGAPGNFRRAVRAIERGWPLPLAGLDKPRSFVGLDNLLGLIELCTHHPAAANQIFLAADGEDVSTSQFLRDIAQALRRPSRLFWLPPQVIRSIAQLLRQSRQIDRLLTRLRIDTGKARRLLGWQPRVSLAEGLRRAVSRQGTDSGSP